LKFTQPKLPQQLTLTAGALAVSFMLAACGGGGSATAPAVADTTAPTMTVTSNAPATGATGAVTYTINASEAVTFNAANITVTGGTKGAFTAVSPTQATIVVTPTANSAGSMSVSFGAGVAVDASGNTSAVNTAAAAPVAFNTIPAGSGNTGACVTSATVNCFNFDETTVGFTAFGDIMIAEAANDPVNAANKVLKIVKPSPSQSWAGVTIATTAANQSIASFGLSTNKLVTLRVYSPAAGLPILLKLENAADGAASIEKSVNTTVANAWETLTFDYTGFNTATVYNKVSVFPNFGNVETSAKTYYFDELKYAPAATPVVVPPAASLVFANNYVGGTNDAAWASAQGGSAGRYIDTSVSTMTWWGDTAASVNGSVSSVYFGYGISSAAKPWGFGGYVKAPSNGTASVAAYNNISVNVWGNDQLFSRNPNVTVILKGPTVAGCEPEIESLISGATPGASSVYTLAKTSFTVKTACPSFNTRDLIWAGGVAQVHFQVLGNQVQYTTLSAPADAPFYPNGLNIGTITFQ
jgi:hypothetical protein